MYFWNSYPFIRICSAFIFGIVAFDKFPMLWNKPELTIAILLLLTTSCLIIAHRLSFYKLRVWNGIFTLSTIAFLGGYQVKKIYHSHHVAHYKSLGQSIQGFSGTIVSTPTRRTDHDRYDVHIHSILGDSLQSATGILHLYIGKDSLRSKHLSYGNTIYVKGAFYPISGPKNPNAFDYKTYLARKNIYGHAFVEPDDIKVVAQSTPNMLIATAGRIRSQAVDIIDLQIPEKRENSIIKALLLGIKDFIDDDTRHTYTSAGALHVLAVSGLHVGIIYLLLQMLVGKLAERGTWGKISFAVICISFIWMYAMITGLSPSVLRAATMFSLISLSKVMAKDSNVFNTLGIAGFILLLLDPYLIYSVSFQLSFAAVFGIVYFQPRLYRLLVFRSWIPDKAWAVTCVSISAQLATFPLSIFYFHQFPTYFLIANLVVIPGAFLLIIIGCCMMLTAELIPAISALLGRILYFLTWTMNECIAYIEHLPFSLVDWLYLDPLSLCMTYAIIITIICSLHFRSFKTLIISAALGMALLAHSINKYQIHSKEHKLVFYAVEDRLAFDHIYGHTAELFVDKFDSSSTAKLSFQIDPFRRASRLNPIMESLSDLDQYFIKHNPFRFGTIGGVKILIIDSTTFHLNFKATIETDIILLNNQAVKNLNWLNQHFKYKHLMIGNENPAYYTRLLKDQAESAGLAVHSLREDGAFVLNLAHKKRADSLPALFTTNPD